jgi:predicted restriction endonuclease
MNATKPTIDKYLFDRHFQAYKSFEESNAPLVPFDKNSSTNTDIQEGYKYEIYRKARERLDFQIWKESDIGSGKIIDLTIQAIEFESNNLVRWDSRYGDEKRPHNSLYEAKKSDKKVGIIEKYLFKLYCSNNFKQSFKELIKIFGKKYSLIAYLFFIKDKSQYLPIAPKYFDKSFELLGIDFKTNQSCSSENYLQFLYLINKIKELLSERLKTSVELLEAHSFIWILSSDMQVAKRLPDTSDYRDLSAKDKETVVKARLGQGLFRQNAIDYWEKCSVTSCKEKKLLEAAHIKPYTQSNVKECLDVFNSLLLTPNIHACFDAGFISFDDAGKIILSKELNEEDMGALGINKNMKLSRIEPEHVKYLAYHRNKIQKS